MKRIKSMHLETARERVIPLIIFIFIIILIMNRVFPSNELIEPYYFMVGILGSTISCLILALLKIKASIHMMAIGGVLMFFIALGIHFNINIIGSIALIFIIAGAVASSRLHLRAHSAIEIVIGFFIGLLPQLVILNYWL
ncbi:MAG: hypothetical protein EX263_11375 [Flavobacteriaceae bacterium]|nr:MAG: hypothetical protein EX263_11375 [Flavobacteriaceae bacterium]